MIEKNIVNAGIIGAGKRGVTCLGSCIASLTHETNLRVSALNDVNPERALEATRFLEDAFSKQDIKAGIAIHGDAQALIDDPNVDLIMISTPQFAHRAAAVPALRSGKKVYLDKPIAHNVEDAVAIAEESERTNNPLILGFTRRYETAWRKAFDLVRDGVIGDLRMMQLRDIIPFSHYFQTWHRRREWSGDALNDKASHHMDVFNWFSGGHAEKVSAFGGRSVFIPDPSAPERCSVCGRDCPYRIKKQATQQTDMIRFGKSWETETEEQFRDDTCVYAPGADIYDHAFAQVAYDNGIVASLFYCLFGPHAEDQETFELVGEKGRIVLTRHSGVLNVISDYGKKTEQIDCSDETFKTSHFGSDLQLIRDVRAFYDGEPPVCGAHEGCEATRMISAVLASLDDSGRTVKMNEIPDIKE